MEKTIITETDIERLFQPILNRIENEDVRKKTVRAWVMACQRGGWRSVEELQGMPFTVLIHQADFATFDPLVMMERNTLIQ